MIINNPYKVLGDTIPELLGRQKELNTIKNQLLKPDPVHLSIIGPVHYGKSVLLNKLAEDMLQDENHYLTVLYWDLRHKTPTKDENFKYQFAEKIKNVLNGITSEHAEVIDLEEPENLFEFLTLVFDELTLEEKKILVILDGFDHLLGRGNITRNLWDNLLDLSRKPALRLVTGSRGKLRELCKSEDSKTSDFWEIFDQNPIIISSLSEVDLEELIKPISNKGIILESSAKKELLNWTGGIPILLIEILKQIFDRNNSGVSIDNNSINKIGTEFIEKNNELLKILWQNCSLEMQTLLTEFDTNAEYINGCFRFDLG